MDNPEIPRGAEEESRSEKRKWWREPTPSKNDEALKPPSVMMGDTSGAIPMEHYGAEVVFKHIGTGSDFLSIGDTVSWTTEEEQTEQSSDHQGLPAGQVLSGKVMVIIPGHSYEGKVFEPIISVKTDQETYAVLYNKEGRRPIQGGQVDRSHFGYGNIQLVEKGELPRTAEEWWQLLDVQRRYWLIDPDKFPESVWREGQRQPKYQSFLSRAQAVPKIDRPWSRLPREVQMLVEEKFREAFPESEASTKTSESGE